MSSSSGGETDPGGGEDVGADEEEAEAFQRELEAGTAEVRRGQDDLLEALRNAEDSARASEAARHELMEHVWGHAQELFHEIQAANGVVSAIAANIEEGLGYKRGMPAEEALITPRSTSGSNTSTTSSRPPSPLPYDDTLGIEDTVESGGDGRARHLTGQAHEVAVLQRHVAELIVARAEQEAEIDHLRALVMHHEKEKTAQKQAFALERDKQLLERQREREGGTERAELEVQDNIEKLEMEAASYLDQLALAQQQVSFLPCLTNRALGWLFER